MAPAKLGLTPLKRHPRSAEQLRRGKQAQRREEQDEPAWQPGSTTKRPKSRDPMIRCTHCIRCSNQFRVGKALAKVAYQKTAASLLPYHRRSTGVLGHTRGQVARRSRPLLQACKRKHTGIIATVLIPTLIILLFVDLPFTALHR